jgi:hypothetical protein
MSGKPPEPPAARPAGSGSAAAGGAQPPFADQRVGPLALTRHVKGDGRSLILYSRERPEEQ